MKTSSLAFRLELRRLPYLLLAFAWPAAGGLLAGDPPREAPFIITEVAEPAFEDDGVFPRWPLGLKPAVDSSGDIAFVGVEPAAFPNSLYFAPRGGELKTLARSGEAVPGRVPPAVYIVPTETPFHFNGQGNMAAILFLDPGPQTVFLFQSGDPASARAIASIDDSEFAPGPGEPPLRELVQPLVNDRGGICFTALYNSQATRTTTERIYTADGAGPPVLVVRTGDALPGIPGARFSTSADPTRDRPQLYYSDRGDVAFPGSKDAFFRGYAGGIWTWRKADRDHYKILAPSDPAPGLGALTIQSINDFHMAPSGDMAVAVTLSNFDGAVFRFDPEGVPSLVARGGQNINFAGGGRAERIFLGGRVRVNALGHVAFDASPSSGDFQYPLVPVWENGAFRAAVKGGPVADFPTLSPGSIAEPFELADDGTVLFGDNFQGNKLWASYAGGATRLLARNGSFRTGLDAQGQPIVVQLESLTASLGGGGDVALSTVYTDDQGRAPHVFRISHTPPPVSQEIPLIEVPADANGILKAPGGSADLEAVVTNRLGAGLPGLHVQFIAPGAAPTGFFEGAAPGSPNFIRIQTDLAGKASVRFTAGNAPGVFLVKAVVEESPVAGVHASTTFGISVHENPPAPLLSATSARSFVESEVLLGIPEDENQKLHGPVFLEPGTMLSSAGGIHSIPPLAETAIDKHVWFFWIDDIPMALFGHPTRYVILDAAQAQPSLDSAGVQKADWWPLFFAAGGAMLGQLSPPAARPASAPGQGGARENNQPGAGGGLNDCAIIAYGNPGENRFKELAEKAESFCKDQLQIQTVNLFTNTSGGEQAPSSPEDLRRMLSEAKEKGCKKIYLFIIAHGYAGGIVLSDEDGIKDGDGSAVDDYLAFDELAAELEGFKTLGVEFCIMVASCHSGSAVAPLQNRGIGGYVATSTDPVLLGYDYYVEDLLKCWSDPEADRSANGGNGNGAIELNEAQSWVKAHGGYYANKGNPQSSIIEPQALVFPVPMVLIPQVGDSVSTVIKRPPGAEGQLQVKLNLALPPVALFTQIGNLFLDRTALMLEGQDSVSVPLLGTYNGSGSYTCETTDSSGKKFTGSNVIFVGNGHSVFPDPLVIQAGAKELARFERTGVIQELPRGYDLQIIPDDPTIAVPTQPFIHLNLGDESVPFEVQGLSPGMTTFRVFDITYQFNTSFKVIVVAELAANRSCATAIPMGLGEKLQGTTCDSPLDFDRGCPGLGNGSVVYVCTALDGSIQVNVCGVDGFVPRVAISTGPCEAPICLPAPAAEDLCPAGGGGVFFPQGAGPLFIYVEGSDPFQCGKFDIEILPPPPNTPAGTDIRVIGGDALRRIEVRFPQVTLPGNTIIRLSGGCALGTFPPIYRPLGPSCMDISTTAQFGPGAKVFFDIDAIGFFPGGPPDPSQIVILSSPDGVQFDPLPTEWMEAPGRMIFSAVAAHFSYFILAGPAPEGEPFKRGDAGGNGAVDLSDAISTLEILFLGTGEIACDDGADSNDDGAVDISDAILTLTYLFLGGAGIPEPGPDACGPDPTNDLLDCRTAAGC